MIRLLVTFMEQRRAPSGAALNAPRAGVEISGERLSVPDYLSLYREVGGPVEWDDRLRMSESDLHAFIHDEKTVLHVLSLDRKRVGLFEAVKHSASEIEITNFGLVPAAQGQRLGPYLLDVGLRALWREKPDRVWLRTDTNDHPAAIRTYQRAGFTIFERRWVEFPD